MHHPVGIEAQHFDPACRQSTQLVHIIVDIKAALVEARTDYGVGPVDGNEIESCGFQATTIGLAAEERAGSGSFLVAHVDQGDIPRTDDLAVEAIWKSQSAKLFGYCAGGAWRVGQKDDRPPFRLPRIQSFYDTWQDRDTIVHTAPKIAQY